MNRVREIQNSFVKSLRAVFPQKMMKIFSFYASLFSGSLCSSVTIFRGVFIVVMGLLFFGLFFQNCSKVSLEKISMPLEKKTKGEICLKDMGSIQKPQRTIFFIDNSGSMGGLDKQTQNGIKRRVQALREFIEDHRQDDQFYISIGTLYQRQAGFLPDPNPVGEEAMPQAQCTFFKPRLEEDYRELEKALAQLNFHSQKSSNNTPFLQIIQRVQSCIEHHISAQDAYDYNFVLVTDGAPTDVTVSQVKEAIQGLISRNFGGDRSDSQSFLVSQIQLFLLFLDHANPNPDSSFLASEMVRVAHLAGGLRSRIHLLDPSQDYTYSGLGLVQKSKMRLKEIIATNMTSAISSSGLRFADSDGDGLTDQEEIALGYDPRNMMSQGSCSDLVYFRTGGRCFNQCPYSHLVTDSDLDGLSDCDEGIVGTNPLRLDTDQDGIPDGLEYRLGLSPIDLSDREGDPDGDQVSNKDEALRYTSPFINDRDLRHSSFIKVFSKERRTQEGDYCYDIRMEKIPVYLTLGNEKTFSSLMALPSENIVRVQLMVTPDDRPSAKPQNLVGFLVFSMKIL
jgi:hypothetical protein